MLGMLLCPCYTLNFSVLSKAALAGVRANLKRTAALQVVETAAGYSLGVYSK